MKFLRSLSLCVLALFGVTSPLLAQDIGADPDPRLWGVQISISPWSAGEKFRGLMDARDLDISGRSVRIGVTRGRMRGSEWGVTFVRRTINEGSRLVDYVGRAYNFGDSVRLTGIMGEQFGSFGTIANRVQIGALIGGGLAKVEGLVFPTGGGTPRDAREVLTLFAHETSFQLLARAEIGAAVLVAPGVKVRVSGGFDWPGTTVLTITGLYFFGGR
jgi:hypothetical protein